MGRKQKNINIYRYLRAALTAAVLAALSPAAALAAGNTAIVGKERIVVPGITGFDNYTDDPKGQRIAGTIIEAETQLLSFQAPPSGPLTRYLLMKVPKEVASKSMTVSEFVSITAYSRSNLKNQKQVRDLATRQAAERRTQINALAAGHDIKLSFDAPILVGVDRDDDRAFTATKLVPVTITADGKQQADTAVMCASSVLVKGKYIIVQLFGPGDEVKWARSTCNQFVADLIAQNK